MPDMTEEEAARLDKYYTENTVETVRGKPGTFAKHRARMLEFDALSAQYLQIKANADHKSIYEVIGDMVRHELAAAAQPGT